MSFLFGDRTPSPFTTNVLDDVRDTVAFAAAVAEADQTIARAPSRIAALREAAAAETARLDALTRAMLDAASAADKGPAGSPTTALASELAALVADRHRAAAASVAGRLADDVRAVEAEVTSARARYREALEALLLVRAPYGASSEIVVELVGDKDEHAYEARTSGTSDAGLTWVVGVRVPASGTWSKALRVDAIADGVAMITPQMSGLIKKEVKLRRQKLDKHVVVRLVDDGKRVRIALREAIGATDGLDLDVDPEARTVTAARAGDADDASVGPFEVDAADVPVVVDLATRLRDAARALPRSALTEAHLDGAPFDGTDEATQPGLVAVVERLIGAIAPIVREIVARSKSDEELVLRRVLDDTRREEIFLPKATLRDHVARLEGAHRELFAPLGLEAPKLEVVVEDETTDAAPTNEVAEAEPPPSRETQALLAALEHIRTIAEQGMHEEAYRQYATIFASPSFAACPPDEQRRALETMLRGPIANASDEGREAHRVALGALQALVLEHRNPVDYELLGLAYTNLDEPEKASEIRRRAQELTRERS